MRRLARIAAALVMLGIGCGGERTRTVPADDAPRIADPEPAAQPEEEVHAAPHGASIRLVALTDAGDAALTADVLGLIRLWPALDGSREPIVVRAGPVRQLALGRDGGELVAALLDPAGGVELLRFGPGGGVIGRARVLHEPGYQELAWSGGVLLARGSDHAIAAIDARGAVRGRLVAEPGERIAAVLARGRAAIAAIEDRERGVVRAVRRIELAGGVRWGATLALPGSLGATLAISPSGRHLAGADAKTGELALLELAPAPRIVRTAGGAGLPAGFLDDETLASRSGTLLSTAPGPDPGRTLRTGHGMVGIGDGVAVNGHGASLVVAGVGEAWFLGYRHPPAGLLRRTGAAIRFSSGSRTLWLDDRLQIVRQAPRSPMLVRELVVDDVRSIERHVVEQRGADQRERTTLVDHATGRRLPLAPDPGDAVAYEPRTHTLATVVRGEVRRWRLDVATGAVEPAGRALRARREATIELIDPAEADGVVAVAYEDTFDFLHVEAFVEPARGTGALAPAARITLADEGVIGSDRRGSLWTVRRSGPKRITRLRAGRVVARFPVPEALRGGAIDPAGERLVMFGEREVVAFDAGGQEQWRSWTSGPRAGVFSAGGDRLFVSTMGGVIVLDAATGRELAASCGWEFGRTAEEPSFGVLGGAPVCAEGRAP